MTFVLSLLALVTGIYGFIEIAMSNNRSYGIIEAWIGLATAMVAMGGAIAGLFLWIFHF